MLIIGSQNRAQPPDSKYFWDWIWKYTKYLQRQQTPNPDAHDPEAVPPSLEQSDEL